MRTALLIESVMATPSADPSEWLERHRPYLSLLARSYLSPGNPARLEASDVVQQTMLDAFAKRDQFRGTTDAESAAWLRQILKHNLADAIRNQQREKRDVRREQTLGGHIDSSFTRTDQWLAAAQSSPSQRAVKQEDLLRLSQALTQLPDAQREAIVLHHLQGLKLADVAKEIGRSEAAVAGLLFRGLKALHALLDE
jgi:RNA polymerase sigma-70 factor (ECF subfamily)